MFSTTHDDPASLMRSHGTYTVSHQHKHPLKACIVCSMHTVMRYKLCIYAFVSCLALTENGKHNVWHMWDLCQSSEIMKFKDIDCLSHEAITKIDFWFHIKFYLYVFSGTYYRTILNIVIQMLHIIPLMNTCTHASLLQSRLPVVKLDRQISLQLLCHIVAVTLFCF